MKIINERAKEIVAVLTGQFVLRGSTGMQGYGSLVIRQQIQVYEDQHNKNVYFATLYGEFRPTSESHIMFKVQQNMHFEAGGALYQVSFMKADGRSFEDIGLGFICEGIDDTVFRVEMDGQVNYVIKNKFGKKGRVFAMGGAGLKR